MLTIYVDKTTLPYCGPGLPRRGELVLRDGKPCKEGDIVYWGCPGNDGSVKAIANIIALVVAVEVWGGKKYAAWRGLLVRTAGSDVIAKTDKGCRTGEVDGSMYGEPNVFYRTPEKAIASLKRQIEDSRVERLTYPLLLAENKALRARISTGHRYMAWRLITAFLLGAVLMLAWRWWAA